MAPVQYDLCVITRAVPHLGRSHLDVARAALEGGARFLQFRDKDLTTRLLVETAGELRELTRQYGAVLVVNDRVDVAIAVGADGVHLGVDDMPVAAARRLLGEHAIVGASAATVAEARAAEAAGADYLGVGPIFATGSKADAGEAIGLGPMQQLKASVALPLLAVGGIAADNVSQVIRAGADGVAVISAVAEAEDMAAATAGLLQRIMSARRAQDPGEVG